MIEFLSEWMRGLILIIFFAIVLDMVLPSSSMQRYARVVMGLMIILMLLSPVLKIYKTPLDDMQFTLDGLLQGGGPSMQGVDEILAQGQLLQDRNQSLTAEQWKTAVGEQVKRTVEQTNTVAVDHVDVRFVTDETGHPKAVESLMVTLSERVAEADPTEGSSAPASSEIKPIEPITPITIGGQSTPEREVSAKAEREPLTAAAREQAADIKAQLAAEYRLRPGQVQVVWSDS